MALMGKGRRRVDPEAFYALTDRLEQVVNAIVRSKYRQLDSVEDALDDN